MKIYKLFLLILFLLSQQIFSQNFRLRIDKTDTLSYPTINILFDIYKPNSEIIHDIRKNKIKLFENNKEIKKFNLSYNKINAPIRIVVLLDISSSMKGNKLLNAKKSILELLNILNKSDEVALITFGNKITIKQGFTSDFVKIKKLINKISKLSSKTHLYDAIGESTSLVPKFSSKENFLLLITDGKDDGSFLSVEDAIKKLKEKKINLFTLGIGKNLNEQILGKLTLSTHGDFFRLNNINNLNRVLQNEYEIITHNYVLSYNTPDSLNEESNKIAEVELLINYNNIEKSITTKFVMPFRKRSDMKYYYYFIIGLVFVSIVFLIIALINRKGQKIEEEPIVINNEEELFASEEGDVLEFDDPGEDSYADNTSFSENDIAQKIKEGKTVVISRKNNSSTEALGYLILKSKKYGTNIYEVHENEILIGRSPQCDIFLDDEEISKLHTKVRVIDGVFYVDDLGSANGTYINGEKVYHAELKNGDEINIGINKFIFKFV